MKKLFILFAATILAVSIAGCTPAPKGVSVTIESAKVVDSLSTALNVFIQSDLGTATAQVGSSSMHYTFPSREIIRVTISGTLTNGDTSLANNSDEQRKAVYQALRDSVTFTIDGEPKDTIYGYWPDESTSTGFTEATLFYLIPEGQSLDDLEIVVNGEPLGDETYTLTFTDFTR